MKLLYKYGTHATIDHLIDTHRDKVSLSTNRLKFVMSSVNDIEKQIDSLKESFISDIKEHGIDMTVHDICSFDDDKNIIGKDKDDVSTTELMRALMDSIGRK